MVQNPLLFILIIIFLLGLSLIGFVLNYQAEAFVGCAKEYCPQEIIDEYYARGGEGKGYWNDFCNAIPEKCYIIKL